MRTADKISSLGDIRRRFRSAAEKELCIENANLLRLGIKNKRIYFVLPSTFRNFAAEKDYGLLQVTLFEQELWN
jgi:hypothetical protein